MHQAALVPAETSIAPAPPAPSAPLRAVGGSSETAAQPGLASGSGGPTATGPRLEIPGYDLAAALALERQLGIGHVLAQVLVRRGMSDPQVAQEFLAPREVYEPRRFVGIDQVVATIQRHRRDGGKIVVHGDYDVDGVCATAIMVRALRSMGADVGWFLPSRTEDGYGLSLATVQRLSDRGTRLLITVDCGITAVDEVAAATAAGLDVVVTDHHAPRADGQLPACPILHPLVNGYPCPELCGTAVAFKLAQALGADRAEEDLELVALATVADLVPLRGENRRLVREGLAALANTGRVGLRALMRVSRTDPSAVDAQALGFRLAPRINAAGRLRRPDAGLELLLTADSERAAEIASELDAINVERRAVEQRITWEAESQVAALGERSAYVLAGEDWHPGVIGIVASRIVERHHRPTVLIALGGEGPAQGSGRSIPGFDLLGALHACADRMIRYGGHRAAAGLTIDPAEVEGLRAAFEDHAEQLLTPDLLQPVERVDAVVSGSELGLALAEELAQLEPCGMGNARSLLLVPGARFSDVRTMGEGRHVRFSVTSGGARARAVAFGCDGKVPGGEEQPLDATFRLERNVWNGAVEPRLVLGRARDCAPATITVLGEPETYLAGVFAELDGGADFHGDRPAPPSPRTAAARTVLDRRGESPLAVLADALAAGGPVLAVCADVARRLPGLAARTGGFALTSYAALEADPARAVQFAHLVALDPPSAEALQALLSAGSGYAHLCWGEAELRFAEQMHELEYGLRTSLVALYRSLKLRRRVAGEELEPLLRGDGPQPRPARLAGRLIRVLAELELVSLDRALPALAIASEAQTELDRSLAYRVYAERYEDGKRFLSSANLRPSG
jgi:single-stranded-DNA-specific exonuclease